MSHENAFLTDKDEWREGRIFGRDHDLLKALRSPPEGEDYDRIEVRLCACFEAWSARAKKGYLVFDIGCGPFTQNRRGLLQGLATYRHIAIAGILPPTNDLLKEHQGSEEVSYLKEADVENIGTANIENKPSILIYKTTTLSAAQELFNGPKFKSFEFKSSRLLVVMDADPHRRDGSRGLSWDQTVEDFWGEGAGESFHLLIRFGDEGAIYKDPKRTGRQVLIFEPRNAEGHFKSYLNRKIADQNALNASLGRKIVDQNVFNVNLKVNLDDAYIAGLAASLTKESTLSLSQLCETQIKEAATTALRCNLGTRVRKRSRSLP
ncbi:hypothetical protein GQ44DRAFT_734025 [Phaeosphaeriaceae sp. PMI808]|nr:hypothetical protein GQ44DRAFT_734025 [Phaeosphaeriaceae sp. PMI808]